MWKNKTTSSISIFGLSMGITCFLLLGTYILNELRYDKFHAKADRIAYVSLNYQSPNDKEPVRSSVTPTGAVPSIKRMFSEVEDGTRVYGSSSADNPAVIKYGDKIMNEPAIRYADSSFFNIFSFDFIAGDASTALHRPNAIVITVSTAKKYFGEENAMGKILEIDGKAWSVTGVVKDVPSFSSVRFNMIGSYQTLARSKTEAWSSANDVSYLLLKSPDQLPVLQQKIDNWINQEFADARKAGYRYGFSLEKLTHVHLYSKVASSGNITYLYIFGAIAISLLIIACINFTNLITAKSAERAHEIGVKKVLGAQRGQLIRQFMLESALVTIFSLAIGLLGAYLLFPFFNQLIGINLSLQVWKPEWLIYGLLATFIVITLISGIWPATIIAAFNPINALQGKINKSKRGEFIRKALVTFQFCISLLFIMSTLIAGQQLRYVQTKDTGLDRSQVLVLDASKFNTNRLVTLKNRLLLAPGISGVTASYDSPVNVQGGYDLKSEGESNDQSISITAIPVEKDFTRFFDIKLIAGENLTDADIERVLLADDDKKEYSFILNKLALNNLGWTPEEAIGKAVNLNGRKGKIKAVVQDFNFSSLREEIRPIVIFPEYNWFGKLFIKINAHTNMAQQLASITTIWKEFNPDIPFDYHFLDQEYDNLYKTEIRTSKILNLFSVCTIVVSCLGLFGLVTYLTQQREKEIGIRKVLGASVPAILRLLSMDFVKLVVIACIIASPIAWLLMNKWLADFAYHIEITWTVFLIAGILALGVTLITISSRAIKAAMVNPVDSLRNE